MYEFPDYKFQRYVLSFYLPFSFCLLFYVESDEDYI